MNWRERRRAKKRAALLAAFRLGGHGTALDMIARVRKETGGAVSLGNGEIYPILAQLEREGLLESWPEPIAGVARPRFYRLTGAGVAADAESKRSRRGLPETAQLDSLTVFLLMFVVAMLVLVGWTLLHSNVERSDRRAADAAAKLLGRGR